MKTAAPDRTPTMISVLRIGAATLAAGLAAGIAGASMTLLLHLVQHTAFGYTDSTFLIGVENASWERRLLGPALGGVLAGLGWWALRRRGGLPSIGALVSGKADRLPFWRALADSALQILVVGSGASVGRETAPRQVAAAFSGRFGRWLRVSDADWRLLLGSAAAGGLAAVYNVPIAGLAFAAEVVGVVSGLRGMVIAGAVSLIGVLVARPIVGSNPTYVYPLITTAPTAWAWGLVCIPVCGYLGPLLSRGFKAAAARAEGANWRLPAALALSGALIGVISWWLPAIPGNGKGVLQLAFGNLGSIELFTALLLVKPLATMLTLRAGAAGGLIMPVLSIGAAIGGLAALAGRSSGLDTPLPTFAIICAATLLAVTQKAPLFGAVFGWELCTPPPEMFFLFLACTYGAVHLPSGVDHLRARIARRSG